jgi:hypothetical protein
LQEWQEWEGISRQWQCGGISNFHYLLHLNGMAQRSFSDLAQYPVFPWVISDYTSETIDLEDPGVYRDLSKPIGALDGERLSSLRERMRGMEEDGEGFLYGTHYSTPAYVIYYMTRSAPEFALHFHGGRFDTPDRAFSSVRGAWEAVTGSSSDVKELIPEFYTSPGTFLRMPEGGLDLGRTQAGVRTERRHSRILSRQTACAGAHLGAFFILVHKDGFFETIWFPVFPPGFPSFPDSPSIPPSLHPFIPPAAGCCRGRCASAVGP